MSGLNIGKLHITWHDMWNNTHGLEIDWNYHLLLSIGFREKGGKDGKD